MRREDILSGGIFKTLLLIALPIMGTSFLQMAYNLVDIIWIGRLGPEKVASVGTAGFFIWLSLAFVRLIQIGAEVKTAQNLGAGDIEKSNKYSSSALRLSLITSISYAFIIIILGKNLIGFFKLGDSNVEHDALIYLITIASGMLFSFFNPIASGIYNGAGNSKMTFRINAVGLVVNMILDPLFIFALDMGVFGAALATVISQFIVSVIFIYNLTGLRRPYKGFSYVKASLSYHTDIIKLSYPVALQSALFTVFAIFIARVIASFGPNAIAVQKIGTQVESLTYMTAAGFSTALSTFTGQNYGAGNYKRVVGGINAARIIMIAFGVLTSLLLFIFPKQIYSIFINDSQSISIGVSYLKIISLSQLFMSLEIALSGALNGLGRTMPASIISIVFTGLRVPFAFILAKPHILGLNGIWWTISVSSMIKGIGVLILLYVTQKKLIEPSEMNVENKISI